ncbi:unnamed protein product [Penicillium salamii]|nr:unnamed protein product [Penicillium salamii]CAG8253918.1 unnamed protein product [Penicillium salamii]
MPVTRSQSKNSVSQDLNPAQENSESSKSLQQEYSKEWQFVEWFDLDYSDNSAIKQTDWKLILKEVRKVDGCRQITWASPMEDDQRLCIFIHRWGRTHQDEFRQSDAITQTMKEVIFLPEFDSPGNHSSSPNNKAFSIYHYRGTLQKFILDCFSKSSRPDMVYEVLTGYFPAEEIIAILNSDPSYRFPRMVNYKSHPWASEDPIGAALTQVAGYVSGEVEYRGRCCKRVAWFFNWKSSEDEEIYKDTPFSRDKNGEWRTVMGSFIDELQGLGLVGYESFHAKFKEIKKLT